MYLLARPRKNIEHTRRSTMDWYASAHHVLNNTFASCFGEADRIRWAGQSRQRLGKALLTRLDYWLLTRRAILSVCWSGRSLRRVPQSDSEGPRMIGRQRAEQGRARPSASYAVFARLLTRHCHCRCCRALGCVVLTELAKRVCGPKQLHLGLTTILAEMEHAAQPAIVAHVNMQRGR